MAQDEPPSENPSSVETDYKKKFQEEVRLRQYTEEVLDSRQQELEVQEAENAQLRKKIEQLKKELAESQGQLSDARSQCRTKGKQLQDAKDQIFQLQPQRKDITDSEAQDMYKGLLGNIQRWVENRLKSTFEDFDSNRLRARPDPSQASRFLLLLRESAKRCIMIDQADEHHVMAIIMNYVWHAFFAKTFYCPLEEGDGDSTLSWIDELEGSMSRLPRGELCNSSQMVLC
jgi:flagellar biosynthesis GTPase FlhF